MKEKTIKFISNKRNIIILYVLFATIASIQSLAPGPITYREGKIVYSSYNNYTIFKNSYYHLKENKDLYCHYPTEQMDLYKYTPTFSVFFGLFAPMPDWVGLNIWNLLNALILLSAIYYLPRLNNTEKGLILVLILIELMTCMQNEQSNALMAGLLVFSFGLLENKKYLLATLCIAFSVYIKLFGIVGFALFLFYPKKWKLALYSTLWMVILFVIPLIYIDFNQYTRLFQSYSNMLALDHVVPNLYTIIWWLHSWFGLDLDKNLIVLFGIVLFLIPLIKLKEYKHFIFRYLTLTSILIWVVIFNHKAESPTYIIAMTGASLWFIKSEKNWVNISLFILAIILTSLSPTDIFPRSLWKEFVRPYALKAFPCILIWMKIVYDMLVFKGDKETDLNVTQTARSEIIK